MIVQKPLLNFSAHVERPACPSCNARMMLARIMPIRIGVELQTFECPKCDHELTAEVPEEDPMKKAAGWLSSELWPPE